MRKYDSYKESGMEWVSTIPTKWLLKRNKDVSTINAATLDNNTNPFYEFKYIDISNVNQNGIINEPEPITFLESPSRARRVLKENDVIVSTVRTYLRAVAFIDFIPKDYIASTGFAVLSHYKSINPTFLAYYCQSDFFIDLVIKNSKGVSYPAINATELACLSIFFPPSQEQAAIAQYLDTKTQTLDKKVNLLEKKIGYYKELRKSIINETVIKGLDKNVKLKDSGIKWIGQIPVHWEVKRLKEIGNIETSSVNKKIEEDEDLVKLVNYIDVYNNPNKEIWNKDDYMLVSAKINQIQNKTLRQGDVLFTPSSETIEDIGVSSVVMENLNNTLYSYHLLRLKFREKIYLNFKKYMLNNDFVQYYFSHSSTGTTRKILGLNTFYNLKVVFPSTLQEQTQIATYLDHKTQTIDKIVGNIQNQITTLKELRKTLINDVVTGKIKVVE
jgi:restriction endonuclease S subunit